MSVNIINVLITGTNGGLGLGICLRLIDDFLKTHNATGLLNLIFTTRSSRKGSDTLKTLQSHLHKSHAADQHQRVTFQSENVDLTSLLSVRDLSRKLLNSDLPRLDAIVCNAGIGGWSGMDWLQVTRDILLDLRNNTTWPEFKLGTVGALTKPQLPTSSSRSSEPPLGEIFCANLFGHYMLVHQLMPLLRACETTTPAKIIWVSSIEPQDYHFQEDDLQGLRTSAPYEHGKRLTDILVLSSNQSGSASSVASFTSSSSSLLTENGKKRADNVAPIMHLFHPGILCTTVFQMSPIVYQAYKSGIYLARLTGAKWSTVHPYIAAHGATWLLLASQQDIEVAEREGSKSSTTTANAGKVKWGTSISRLGTTTVRPTEVARWGLNGSGEPYAEGWWGGKDGRGRKPGAKEAKREDVQEFVGVGGRVWKEMEKLRVEWEGRIAREEKAV